MNTSLRVLAALVALFLGNTAADAQFLGMPRYYLGPHAHPLVGPRSLRPLRSVPFVEVREGRSSTRTERSAGAEQVGDPLEEQTPFTLVDVSGKRNAAIAQALAQARTWKTGGALGTDAGLHASVRDPVVLGVGKDPQHRRVLSSDAEVLPRSAVHWAPLPDGLREVYRDSSRAVLIVAGEKAGRYTVYAVVLRPPPPRPMDPEKLPEPKKADSDKKKAGDAKKESSEKEPAKEDAAEPRALAGMPLIAEEVVEFVPFVIEVAGPAPADGVTPPSPDKPPVVASTAPIAVDGFSVLFIVGKGLEDQLRMSPAQRSMLDSAELKAYLDKTCAKIGGQPAWRNFATTATVSQEPWRTAMARTRGPAPWLIISNGRTGAGYEGPLPGARATRTADALKELMELFRKYGG